MSEVVSLGVTWNRPGAVRVVGRDGRRERLRVGTQILLADHAVGPDDERHDATGTVVGRPRDQGESTAHRTIRHVRSRTARRTGTLRQEDLDVVAVVRSATGVR